MDTTEAEGRGHDDDLVLDLAALKALGHPLRAQILDALSAYGAATASTLAERFGESSGAMSYHLRQLEKHGLVREDADRGVGRERWWMRVPRPISLDATKFDADSAERMASRLVVTEWQRNRQDRLQRFLAEGFERLDPEWIENSGIMTSNLQLTLEQTKELTEALDGVVTGFIEKFRNQRVAGARPVQVHIDVFPLVDGAVQGPGDVGGGEKDEQ
jgi:DNA-binding transcriptional ArsR family regulator